MFQSLSILIVLVLVIGGIYSVIQYFKSESTPSTPTPVDKDPKPTGTTPTTGGATYQVSPQITDSVTMPVAPETAPKAKTKKKRYYYKPKGANKNKTVAKLKSQQPKRIKRSK